MVSDWLLSVVPESSELAELSELVSEESPEFESAVSKIGLPARIFSQRLSASSVQTERLGSDGAGTTGTVWVCRLVMVKFFRLMASPAKAAVSAMPWDMLSDFSADFASWYSCAVSVNRFLLSASLISCLMRYC